MCGVYTKIRGGFCSPAFGKMIHSTRLTSGSISTRATTSRLVRLARPTTRQPSQRVYTELPPQHGGAVTESWVEEVCELKGADGEGKELAMACTEALSKMYEDEHQHPSKSGKDNLAHHMIVASSAHDAGDKAGDA
eukprot:gene23631-9160_t